MKPAQVLKAIDDAKFALERCRELLAQATSPHAMVENIEKELADAASWAAHLAEKLAPFKA